MKPLIWKELRENVRWIPIGMLVTAAICYMACPTLFSNNQLLATGLLNYFAIVMPLLAFALGVVQSYRDLQPAAGAYLNHRGVTSSDVFLSKVVSGFAIYMVSVIVPVAALAMWVAYRGMWFYPMRPAQVVPGLVFAMITFAMHPAAMLMMSRSASWWGTRLFPLAPAGAALVPFYSYLRAGGWYWAIVCFVVAIPTLAWMIAVARQGWLDLSSDPPASNVNPSLKRKWLLPSYMTVGATLCLVSVIVFSIGAIESASRSNVSVPTPYTTLATEENSDELWLITQLQTYDANLGNYSITTIGGETAKDGAMVNAKSDVAKGRVMNGFQMVSPFGKFVSGDGFFTAPNSVFGTNLRLAYDSRGYLIGYEQFPQLRWVKSIAADGVHPAGELIGAQFDCDPIANSWAFNSFFFNRYPIPLIGSSGLWFIDNDPIAIRKIIEMQIDGVGFIPSKKGDAPRLLIRSGSELHEFKLIDQSGTDDWYFDPGSDVVYNPAATKGLKLDVELIRKFRLPDSIDENENLNLGWTPSALFVSVSNARNSRNEIVYRLKPDGMSETITFSSDPASLPKTDDDKFSTILVVAGMFPGAVVMSGLATAAYIVLIDGAPDPLEQIASYPIMTATFIISFITVTTLSFWLVRCAAYRRGLSRSQTTRWTWAVPLLGLAAPLSIIAIYRLVHREPCPDCQGLRRVDEETCESCGTHWQPPARQGIEIVECVSP